MTYFDLGEVDDVVKKVQQEPEALTPTRSKLP